ncbi:hypothetical protein C1645_747428 [Glomus cerebriforme]|uniref:Uncharacterized protein n=1 Tax=Glomus cerebriforme TaxID=658196 RepID=A0A397TRR6_9GLOM|nr:hypothetical protein C1645_747428 [Glomus cerebriforme]
MELLILLLFEKYKEFSPNILQYIHNSLLYNIPLLESFNALFIISSQRIFMCESINTEKQELKDDVKKFLYEQIISIYMKKNKYTSMKKSNIPKNPMLGLIQLQIWVQLDITEEIFSKMFLVNNVNNKRKKNLIPLILKHLKKDISFSNKAISKGQIFAV